MWWMNSSFLRLYRSALCDESYMILVLLKTCDVCLQNMGVLYYEPCAVYAL